MARRSIFVCATAIVAMLALVAPALAGGWAVATLDSLPREVRAGASFQLGFMVRRHGVTPTNKDLNGNPLRPVLTAIKQAGAAKAGESIRAEARQHGPAGHYVVDVSFPSDGVWGWQIALPTYYVQDSPSGGNAAILAPLTVLPAAFAAAPAAQPATATLLGLNPAALRWGGIAALVAALAIGLYGQRGALGRRGGQSQKEMP